MMMLAVLLMSLLTVRSGWAAKVVDDWNYDDKWKQYFTAQSRATPPEKYPYHDCFVKASKAHKLPLTLLLAVARGESYFNPTAKSSADCYGVMQILWPGTANHLGITRLSDLLKPCVNIDAGARYLREMLNRYNGNIHLTLAAYNYGPGRIPVGAARTAIPEGARWYSGYIYHHLQKVLKGASVTPIPGGDGQPTYRLDGRVTVITFTHPSRAKGFYNHYQEAAPKVRLDWFEMGLGRFRVVLLYKDEAEKRRGVRRLKELGFTVREG